MLVAVIKTRKKVHKRKGMCGQIWEILSTRADGIPEAPICPVNACSILLQDPATQCTWQTRTARKLCHTNIRSQWWIGEENNQHTFLTQWGIYTISQTSPIRFGPSQATYSITRAPSVLLSLSSFPTPCFLASPPQYLLAHETLFLSLLLGELRLRH